jgi:hypothetical protein
MIFRHGEAAALERVQRAIAVQPCRGDKPRDRSSDDLFDEVAPLGHAPPRLGRVESEEFAFARRHPRRLEPIAVSGVSAVVLVGPAMEEHFDSTVRPLPQSRGEWRSGDQRLACPMVRHNQHRETITHGRRREVEQPLHLRLERRRDVMD